MEKHKPKKIIVTGGCGYIGSHTIVDLIQHGFEVISVDSFINSKESVLDNIEKITGKRILNHQVDLSRKEAWKQIADKEPDVDGIIHFAALKAVGESVKKPLEYYKNNLGSLLEILEWLQYCHIENFIFSSSCTVYGNTNELPVNENCEFKPCSSPYGRTKQMGEWILKDFASQSKIKVISLRYFNPAGAHDSLLLGEDSTDPPLNLVPVITETVVGKRNSLVVFGNDYDTPDGSCIRDYIHVMDIAHAHTLSIKYLIDGIQKESYDSFNLGMEKGMSVFEIINTFEKVNKVHVNYKLGPRRPGDMAAIYADTKKANTILNWKPVKTIEDILRSAWLWEQKR